MKNNFKNIFLRNYSEFVRMFRKEKSIGYHSPRIYSGWAMAFLFGFLISCKKNEEVTEKPEVANTINFPAAYVVNGWDNSISVVDLRDDKVKKLIQLTEVGRFPHHIYLSPDKSKLAVALPAFDFTQNHSLAHDSPNLLGGIAVIDAVSGKIIQQIPLPKINHNANFSPNGKEIWSALMIHGSSMYVFDSETGIETKKIAIDADPSEVTFSKNKRYAFVAPTESSNIHVIDVDRKLRVADIKVDLFPSNIWSASDGKIYVENKTQKSINIINPDALRVEEAIDLNFKPGHLAYNQALNELWVCQAGEDKITYFERKNNKWEPKGQIQTGADAHWIAFTKDDKLAYIANQQANTISVVDVIKHQKIKDIPVGSKPNGIVLRD